MSKPAGQMSNQRIGCPEQTVCDGTDRHDIGGKDEHRHGQQHVAAVKRIHHLICHDAGVLTGNRKVQEAGNQHCHGNRNATKRQARESGQQNGKFKTHRVASRGARTIMPCRPASASSFSANAPCMMPKQRYSQFSGRRITVVLSLQRKLM